jgi:hypothetical protein
VGRRVSWAKLADNFHSHPKSLSMGLDGGGLYARGLSYSACYLTDGFLPADWAAAQAPKKIRDKLVKVGAWKAVDGGYAIVDYLDYNPSKMAVQVERAKAKARMSRKRSGEQTTNEGGNNGDVPPAFDFPDKTRQEPVAEEEIVSGASKPFALKGTPEWFASQLRDSNEQTALVLQRINERLPEAAFHSALESLRARRQRRPALESEARYFVATLKTMLEEGQYTR